MRCEVCGNDYDKPLQINYEGTHHSFDCFECAIAVLAPKCARCGTRVIGHGVEGRGQIFCSAHCAQQMGHHQARDHI